MNDSQYNDNEEDLRPRGLKALFIHLAGADPKVFAHLPPSEASDFAKMGFTVLIPFTLALTAGTFTVYTLQDAPKSWLTALPFGAVWALMILGMDVAIMSQLVKRAPVAAQPQETGLRQAYGASNRAAPPPVKKQSSGFIRRMILALLRIMIAATLGAVMSHCLVLAIFKGRVQSRIEEVRTEMRDQVEDKEKPALDKLEKQVAMATRVQGTADRDQFLASYDALQIELGAKDTVVVKPAGTGAQEVDSGIASTMKPYEEQITQLTTVSDEASSKALMKEKEIDRMKDELLQAEEARRNEIAGIAKTYTWYTPAFKAGMPTETSKFAGNGSRVEGIDRAIGEAKAIIAVNQDTLKKLQEQAKLALDAVQAAVTKKNDAKGKLLENNTTGIVEKIRSYEEAQKNSEKVARAMLDKVVTDLSRKLDTARTQYEVRVKPITGSSYDLLEQTEALHDLALGHGSKNVQASKQWTILGLIILILICLMFIDLTPLMMKMMHPPGYYDMWVAKPQPPPNSGGASRRNSGYREPPRGSGPAGSPPPPPPPRRR